jgi:hypothetical protein
MKSKRGTHFGPLPKADVTAVLEAVAVGALPPSTSRWRSGLPSLPKEGRVSESHPLVEEGEAGTGGGGGGDGGDGDAELLLGEKKMTKAEAKMLRQMKAQNQAKRDKPRACA